MKPQRSECFFKSLLFTQCKVDLFIITFIHLNPTQIGLFENLGGPGGSEELPHYLIYTSYGLEMLHEHPKLITASLFTCFAN